MSDQILTQTVPATQNTQAPVQAEPQKPKEDLITRASKVSLTPANPEKGAEQASQEASFNVNDIAKIQDPSARKLVEDAYKSFQADYTRKTQSLASERKEMESLKAKLESSGQYTPEKIHQLINDPSFVQAAQEYQRRNGNQQVAQSNTNGDLTDEEFSYLTTEQQKLYLKTKQVEQTNQTILSRLHSAEVNTEDTNLRTRYANYDPMTVNDIYQGMMSGKIQATREHLWKVADYENAVNRAYKLGLEDRKIELGEKAAASSQTNGYSVTTSGELPVREKNESGIEYFKKIALHNASKLMKK